MMINLNMVINVNPAVSILHIRKELRKRFMPACRLFQKGFSGSLPSSGSCGYLNLSVFRQWPGLTHEGQRRYDSSGGMIHLSATPTADSTFALSLGFRTRAESPQRHNILSGHGMWD